MCVTYIFYRSSHLLYLHSFPTRRSSDLEAKTILTRYETPNDPPNYYVRELTGNTRKAVTDFKDPQPQLRGVTHQLITYRSEEHTSELQSPVHLVCRLLLEKKKLK